MRAGIDRPSDSSAAEVLRDALAVCDRLLLELSAAHADHRGLAERVSHADADWNHLFERVPSPCVCTDVNGFILRANPAAGALLSISPRHLDARLLTHFAEDRDQFIRALRTAAWEGVEVQGTLTIRPRDRAPVAVDMRALRRTPADHKTILWFLQPIGAPVDRPSRGRPRIRPSDGGGPQRASA